MAKYVQNVERMFADELKIPELTVIELFPQNSKDEAKLKEEIRNSKHGIAHCIHYIAEKELAASNPIINNIHNNMSDSEKPLDENQVIAKYKELQSTCQSFATKMSELEQELSEHRLVEETLIPLDVKRRAFRLVGGVLVERTVGEVLPSVVTNRENLVKVVDNIRSTLQKKQKELVAWKLKYNIKTAEEAEAIRKQQGV
eukprot:scaffold1355_cov165-Chaetoceros_neogracile.AAC.18